MEKINIKTITKDSNLEGLLLVKLIEDKISQKNTKYYRLLFTDGEGEIEGNIFSSNYNLIKDYKSYESKVVYVKIKTQEYQGKLNCIIDSMKIIDDDSLKQSFLKFSSNPETYEIYKKELVDIIDSIKDPEIKKLNQYVFLGKYRNEFLTYPAAKTNHHNGFGGLLEHSINLAKLALCCADNYVYDFDLDKDLLISGALYQDIGKIFEFEVDDTYNVKYSKVGTLKGHITIGNEILYKALAELKIDAEQDKFCRLSHIILSHHGLQEYGSPTFPSTPEAILIARLDKLDADIKAAFSAIKSIKEGEEYSSRIFSLENVQILGPASLIYIKNDTGIPQEGSTNIEELFDDSLLLN